MNLGTIVEGHGEVYAIPILLRRMISRIAPALHVTLLAPFRIPRGKIVIEAQLKRGVELVARKCGPGQPLLIILDADSDPACVLGPRLLRWAHGARDDRKIGVVAAKSFQKLERDLKRLLL